MKSGRSSSMADAKALSWAFSQAADLARSPKLAALLKIPPNNPLAASKAPEIAPKVDA
jgi:hypothetical protein